MASSTDQGTISAPEKGIEGRGGGPDFILGRPLQELPQERRQMLNEDREHLFATLFREHYHQLFGYVYTLVRHYADAEDVVQRTSFVLWEKFADYRPGTSFATWACAIARFEALNFLKQQRRYRAHFSEAVQLRLAATMTKITTETVNRRAQVLDDCIDKLPESQRNLLRCCFGGTQTVAEVAQKTGRTTHSIYSSLRNIRGKLLDCVDHSVPEEVNQ
jgi:RNA polymerase sigma-70 factor, ECF subfamily